MTISADERRAMSDLFAEVGPDAPTMCAGWTTRTLLAHLLVRERRPDAAAGIVIPWLARHMERTMDSVAEQPYADMIDQFRDGPPLWSPWAVPVLGDRGNIAEFFVHHEDIRRAQPEWEPRAQDARRDDAIWNLLKAFGRVLHRRSPVGVVLRCANRPDVVAKKAEPAVTVVGLPGEILLHAYGRDAGGDGGGGKVRVVVQGEPSDIESFSSASRGV